MEIQIKKGLDSRKKQLLSHGNILSAMELIPLTEDKSDLREL